MESKDVSDKFLVAVGKVLSDLRTDSNYSRAHVSREVGRTTSWLSMVEAGKTATTLNSLVSLLDLYRCALSSFFEVVEEEGRDTSDLGSNIAVIQKAEWQTFEAIEGMVYLLPPFAGKLQGSKMDVTPVVLKGGRESGIVLHSGEEVLYVLAGEIELRFYEDAEGKNRIGSRKLRQGDAAHFFASVRHKAVNNAEQDAEYLVIRCPKRFS